MRSGQSHVWCLRGVAVARSRRFAYLLPTHPRDRAVFNDRHLLRFALRRGANKTSSDCGRTPCDNNAVSNQHAHSLGGHPRLKHVAIRCRHSATPGARRSRRPAISLVSAASPSLGSSPGRIADARPRLCRFQSSYNIDLYALCFGRKDEVHPDPVLDDMAYLTSMYLASSFDPKIESEREPIWWRQP